MDFKGRREGGREGGIEGVPVHPNQLHRQGIGDELLLDRHRVLDDSHHPLLRALYRTLAVEQAGEVAVQAFVAGDELVGEGEALREGGREGKEEREGEGGK